MYKYTPLTSETPVLWTPPSQEQQGKKAIKFRIAPPTPLHEDNLNSHLAVLGLTKPNENDIRMTMISECYELFDEATADEYANLLDDVWERQGIHMQQLSDWMEQERERRIDIARGVDPEKIPPNPMPESLVSARQKAKHALLVRDIQNKSIRIRMLVAEQTNFANSANALMVRMHLLPSADNFTFEDGRDDLGLLSDNDVARVKNAIGSDDFTALVAKIDSLYSFSKEEEGNLDSLSENPSPPIGSPEPSDVSEISNGNSTESDTGPVPTEG